MGDDVVVGNLDADAIRIGSGEGAKQIFIAAVARTEDDQRQLFAHDFVCDFGDEVESFLIGKAGNNSEERATGNVGKIESLEKVLLAHKFAGQILGRVLR